MLYYRLETVQKNGNVLSIDSFINIKKNFVGDQRKVIVGLKSFYESFLGEKSLFTSQAKNDIHSRV